MQPSQFSWTRKPPKIEDWEALKASVVVAARAMSGNLRDRTGGALYFHAARLGSPKWAQGLTRLAQIGAHTFYPAFTPRPGLRLPRPSRLRRGRPAPTGNPGG